jgi:hypothetical protein
VIDHNSVCCNERDKVDTGFVQLPVAVAVVCSVRLHDE